MPHIEFGHCRKSTVLYNFLHSIIGRLVKNTARAVTWLTVTVRFDNYPMDSNKPVYTETDLRQLELSIDELIDTVGLLKHENARLRQQKDELMGERAQLIENTEAAKTCIEAMISRLRLLESDA